MCKMEMIVYGVYLKIWRTRKRYMIDTRRTPYRLPSLAPDYHTYLVPTQVPVKYSCLLEAVAAR